MITRISGRVVAVTEEAVLVERDGLTLEVHVPVAALGELQRSLGTEVALLTVMYLEGNPAGAHLTPRLLGFLTAADRAFFQLFTRIKGISTRRALRAMALPTAQLAAAIESADTRLLQSLPEIGKKTAAQIVAELQGKLHGFLQVGAGPTASAEPLSDVQKVAVEILVQWGDRRADAQRWVTQAVAAEPALNGADEIVRAAYRVKQAG